MVGVPIGTVTDALWFAVRHGEALFETFDDHERMELRRALVNTATITDWVERRYHLARGDVIDFPFELDGLRLCSDRLRRAIDAVAGPEDSF